MDIYHADMSQNIINRIFKFHNYFTGCGSLDSFGENIDDP
jgi:hypothetical protein